MWQSLGNWIVKSYHEGYYTAGGLLERGFMRFKVKVSLDKANVKRLKAILYEQESWNRVLDLTVDVWGSAGPDCRTMPVLAGS